jgi:hypothetical protein
MLRVRIRGRIKDKEFFAVFFILNKFYSINVCFNEYTYIS